MFYDANTRTEYGMLFKQAADSLCASYGVKKTEEASCCEKSMKKKDDKDADKSPKH
jgi:hypothetical protein